MPFPFAEVCVLLEHLKDVTIKQPPLLRQIRYERNKEILNGWFKSHRTKINQLDANGTAALLSTLLPEWRTDRVYNIQAQGLLRMLCRILNVSSSTRPILEAYKQPGAGDLGACLERLMKAGGTIARPPVTMEEVDYAMQSLAGGSSFSDPSIPQLPRGSSGVRDMLLGDILKRMTPQQGKWFARLILKDFGFQMDEDLLLKTFHFLLPDLLQFHRDFAVVASLLKDELAEFYAIPDPDSRSQRLHRRAAAARLKPKTGVKVGRPNFYKARSIDHCLNMVGSKSWVLERKYDGEYCEIHVDLRLSPDPSRCIKIFSKSGKDSTADRAGLHQTLVDALRLGKPECRFKKQAIFLGEMVVYSDLDDCVLPFEKIRKHVTRSGRRIGTDLDSQPHPHEHLAVVFFDLLLLDDEVVMAKSVEERRVWLREAYRKIPRRAMGAEWKKIEFDGSQTARKRLVEQFSASIARRCEGLILKPCDVPYFSLEGSSKEYGRSYIKLKKDYIDGHGDEADFAVIGASYDAQQAATSGRISTRWTRFHLGCLVDQRDSQREGTRSIFKYVGAIDQERCIPSAVLEAANALTTFGSAVHHVSPKNFDIESHQRLKMDVVLDEPFVFEVLGSGFEKPSNCDFFMLRHARVKKLHEDRTWRDCITFDDLQAQAAATRATPVSESQETRRWIVELEQKHKRQMARAASRTPSSRRTSTPNGSVASISQQTSPRRSAVRRTLDLQTTSRAETSELLSSPLQHTSNTEPRMRSPKRSLENDSVVLDRQTKKQRIDTGIAGFTTAIPANTSPLSEISINADAQSQRQMSRMTRRSTAVANVSGKIVNFLQPVCQAVTHPRSATSCEGSTCAFHNTAVYLVPCVAKTPYIAEDLLGSHTTVLTTDFSHWDRDSFSHPQMTETTSESQSHPGMRKVIIVEKERRTQVQAVVQQVLQLNAGRFRERIEVYDWRVLEQCQKHDQTPNLLKKHFLGATLFDDTQKRALFVSNCGWLSG